MNIVFFEMPMRQRRRATVISVTCLLLFGMACFWFVQTKEIFKNAQLNSERCLSELASVRHQLSLVSEYKAKMDRILTETQKEFHVQKDQDKEMMENYFLTRHELLVCEQQYQELERRSKDVMEELRITKQELEKCKKPAG